MTQTLRLCISMATPLLSPGARVTHSGELIRAVVTSAIPPLGAFEDDTVCVCVALHMCIWLQVLMCESQGKCVCVCVLGFISYGDIDLFTQIHHGDLWNHKFKSKIQVPTRDTFKCRCPLAKYKSVLSMEMYANDAPYKHINLFFPEVPNKHEENRLKVKHVFLKVWRYV